MQQIREPFDCLGELWAPMRWLLVGVTVPKGPQLDSEPISSIFSDDKEQNRAR